MTIDLSRYRDMAIEEYGEELVLQALDAGVPVPFFEVGFQVTALNGRAGEIRAQFDDEEEAGAYVGSRPPRPGDLGDSAALQHLEETLGAPLVAISGGISVCWDPRSWDGGSVPKR